MNINRAINLLFLELSKKYKVFYMERITYKKFKSYKSYYVRIEKKDKEIVENFNSKTDLLKYLMEMNMNGRKEKNIKN